MQFGKGLETQRYKKETGADVTAGFIRGALAAGASVTVSFRLAETLEIDEFRERIVKTKWLGEELIAMENGDRRLCFFPEL